MVAPKAKSALFAGGLFDDPDEPPALSAKTSSAAPSLAASSGAPRKVDYASLFGVDDAEVAAAQRASRFPHAPAYARLTPRPAAQTAP